MSLLPHELPPYSVDLIKELDQREQVTIRSHQDLATEEGRLLLARKLGRRDLVNELKAILAKQQEGC